VLTEFGGGDGQVGIHGTNDPSSIGRPVSHGCVRVANDVITRLATTIPIGTQVTIV
jgi:lipoprotein-anchoring transpeptidase ErfK/SrfK